jgi:poly(beta-D-mannuronate) lyase
MKLAKPASALLLALTIPAFAADHVRDTHASLIDVPARRDFLSAHATDPQFAAAIKALGSCKATPAVPAPQGPMQIPHHYMHGSNGPTNPGEKEATITYGEFESRITHGMNRWLATGDESEAQCALAQLDSWAQATALTNYDARAWSQSWFQAEWTLCAAGVTESILFQDKSLDPVVQARVVKWLDKATRQLIDAETPNGSKNNHHYWRALAAISVGVTANDDKLFRFALDAYKGAIDGMDPSGAFPLEMARHENAIHYQSFALAPLVEIAEYAERQGVDLYAYANHGHTLKDAIVFLGRAIADPTLVRPFTSDEQRTGFGAGDFEPFVFYIQRFGPAGLPDNILHGINPKASYNHLGGNTFLLAAR